MKIQVGICRRPKTIMLANEKKQKWAEEYASRIGQRFEQWQVALDIGGDEYVKYLTKQLIDCCDKPVWHCLIESTF